MLLKKNPNQDKDIEQKQAWDVYLSKNYLKKMQKSKRQINNNKTAA